jgi:hypothetical protein
MAAIDNAERTRHWLLDKIREERGSQADKARKLQEELHAIEIRKVELAQQLTRASEYDPASGNCPRCTILRGVASELRPVSLGGDRSGGGEAPGPMTCPACMWDETVTM